MTYRDDHDAALARAESLEAELADVERERDRLRAELERAKHAAPRPAPEPVWSEPARVSNRPLDDGEVGMLLSTLEQGVRTGADSGVILVIAMTFVVFAVLALFGSAYKVAGLLLGLGALFGLAGLVSSGNKPDEWRPVLDALRDRPDRIITIREVTYKYDRMLVIATSDHEMRVHTNESAALLALLARRCTRARFENA